MALTNAQRQKAFRDAMRARGYEAVTVWVHSHQVHDVKVAASRMFENADLEIGTLRNAATGRYQRAK